MWQEAAYFLRESLNIFLRKGENMTKKTVSLFALACVAFIITGPIAAWTAYKLAQPPGTFSNQVINPGEAFSPTRSSRTVEVWGTPADLDIQGVQCQLKDESIKLDTERNTTDIKGTKAVLLFVNDGDYTVFDRISCEGGGLEQIYMSTRLSMDKARIIIIASLVAAPLAGGFGIVLFRRIRSFR